MKKDVFQAIADPTRRAILALVATQAMTPGDIAEHFGTSRQAVSKHIRVLADSRLLKQEQAGREIYYTLAAKKLKEVDQWLEPFRRSWDDRFSQLDTVLKNLKNKKP